MPDVYYPFRSLFTGRQQNELEFGVEDKSEYFSFKAKIPKELVFYSLIIPQIEEKEVAEVDENDLSKKTIKYPQIYLDGEFFSVSSTVGGVMASTSLQPATPEVSLPQSVSDEVSMPLTYIREGNVEVRVPKIYGYYSSNMNPILMNLDPKTCDQFNKGIYEHGFITDPITGEDLLRLTSVGSSNCLDFDLPNLSQDMGYLVTIENRNIEGKSLLFSVINKNSQRADLETYLPKNSELRTKNKELNTSFFVIPPMEKYGLGYSLHFDNISIGRVKTVNDLGKITVNPFPYRFLSSLKIVNPNFNLQPTTYNSQPISVSHPNPSLYQVSFGSSTPGESSNATPGVSLGQSGNVTLVLSQSYDDGWKAYEITNDWFLDSWYMKLLIPFFQQEIKEHVMVNNWENGWQFDNARMQECKNGKCSIAIVYLPQYLEYLGFLLLGTAVVIVFLYPRGHSNQPLDFARGRQSTIIN